MTKKADITIIEKPLPFSQAMQILERGAVVVREIHMHTKHGGFMRVVNPGNPAGVGIASPYIGQFTREFGRPKWFPYVFGHDDLLAADWFEVEWAAGEKYDH